MPAAIAEHEPINQTNTTKTRTTTETKSNRVVAAATAPKSVASTTIVGTKTMPAGPWLAE